MHRRTELSRITRFCYTPAGRISTLASPKSGYVPRVRYHYFDVKHFETVLLNLVNLTPVPLLDWDRSGALSIFEYFLIIHPLERSRERTWDYAWVHIT